MSASLAWTLAEIGRVGFTHGLDPDPIAAALGIERAALAALFATGIADRRTPPIGVGCASFVLNVLIRLEVRCCGDATAIRAALARPCADLAGASVAEALGAGPDLFRLVTIRAAVGNLPVPKVRMWRVADTYS